MQKKILLILGVISIIFYSCTSTTSGVKVSVKSSSENDLNDIVVELNDSAILQAIEALNEDEIVVKQNGEPVPFQLVKNSKGTLKSVLALIVAKSDANLNDLQIVADTEASNQSFDKRTYAEIVVREGGEWKKITTYGGKEQFEYQGGEWKSIDYLKVPEQHTDHSYYIKYEGPGWESDKIAYRFYLDWRNAVDIFGKKVNSIVLPEVGSKNFENYHNEQEWGMDVLKVGESLGIGSFGYWTGEKAQRVATTDSIISKVYLNGDIRSGIKTKYFGWSDAGIKTTLKSIITIDAGSRWSHEKIYLTEELDNICTGIVKHDGTELLKSTDSENDWNYIATFGKQSLNNDMLGMAVFFKNTDLVEITSDEYSEVVVLKPTDNFVEYYFGATWEKDGDNITTTEDFSSYLNNELARLNNQLEVSFK